MSVESLNDNCLQKPSCLCVNETIVSVVNNIVPIRTPDNGVCVCVYACPIVVFVCVCIR